MLRKLQNWLRRRTYREGKILSRFIARDIRRDILIVSAERIDEGICVGRVRTTNLLYLSRGLCPEPEFDPATELSIDTMWLWSGKSWGGLPDGTSIAEQSRDSGETNCADRPSESVPIQSTTPAMTAMPEMASQIIVSRKLFQLSDSLVLELRRHRQTIRLIKGATETYDAFLLDPGLGPATYLSSDGRVIWDDAGIWEVNGTLGEAIAAISSGARKTRIDALLTLLPRAPSDANECSTCGASGRFNLQGQVHDVDGRSSSIVCMHCCGLGWTAPSLDLRESVLDANV